MINTLQAAYTDVDTMLGPVSRWLCERDALIGVGLTGMMDHPALAFDPALQTRAATGGAPGTVRGAEPPGDDLNHDWVGRDGRQWRPASRGLPACAIIASSIF